MTLIKSFFSLKRVFLSFRLLETNLSIKSFKILADFENLRLNLQVSEERLRRLQDSEFKLECEIEELIQELE